MYSSRLLRCGRSRTTNLYARASHVPRLRRLSTPTSEKATSQQTSRAPTVLTLTAVTGVVAAYFLWPSKSRSAPTSSGTPISASHFTPVTLTATESAGPNAKIIVLNIPRTSLPRSSDATLLNPIWSIFIKDDDIQVERPYTPLEGIDENGNMRFWIKKYPRGEVGKWLHSKRVGDTVEIRGPLTTFRHLRETFDEVVMISGGTGFSPFYQLLHYELLRDSAKPSHTRFTLLHSSKIPAELPPPELLQPLLDVAKEHPERLRIGLFVDSMEGQIAPAYDLQVTQINKSGIERFLGQSSDSSAGPWWKRFLWGYPVKENNFQQKNVVVLVCGPEPMITAIAGPYGRNYSQGAVGGVLAELGFKPGQVWKF
ncbi:uncharacterized protein STEHIDRAFT_167787 [Stereum hirsutum FP-91666 SS1]|uniref:uncharacterized protein n=1 Tax=Stereum hirsutum (strain FP-91666) TaxID=721885 RepID=UPI000440C843|nr:uncharacterized protein STEHIDRAFT_167787 [Stereum hirsutum FP-91666 SS1]EIM88640.1 hypothetical protein STEHIDRAFT_167787 [Stereum hirsutum FP-91666 SS1]